MTVYMLTDSTKHRLPIDISFSLKSLSVKHNIPYQTLKNRLYDGKKIKYANMYIERVKC